jgi:tRNA A37 threonylcarbamoyladenosine synthetase subunit TsaC/SUA5/YrdC
VRIPDHWIKDIVKELKIPIISTSVNKAGDEFMTSSETIDTDIQSKVEFVISDGEKTGNPSTLVDLTSAIAKVTQR